MSNKRKQDKTRANASSKKKFRPKDIFKRTNRGILLDVIVFFVNVFLMQMLTRRFVGTVQAAYAGDGFALVVIFLFFLSLMFLAPVGAVLKRWHFHARLAQDPDHKPIEPNGCLFSPILYYSVMVVIFSVVNAFIFQYFWGDDRENAGPFIGSIIVGMVGMGIHTWLVYRYFSPPKEAPRSAFMLSPISELLGDVCIYVNMLFFQIMWNLLAAAFGRPNDVSGVIANLLALMFAALLIYFPPRMLYLAEDIHRGRTWFFIFLANLPVLYHAVFGSGHVLQIIH